MSSWFVGALRSEKLFNYIDAIKIKYVEIDIQVQHHAHGNRTSGSHTFECEKPAGTGNSFLEAGPK